MDNTLDPTTRAALHAVAKAAYELARREVFGPPNGSPASSVSERRATLRARTAA